MKGDEYHKYVTVTAFWEDRKSTTTAFGNKKLFVTKGSIKDLTRRLDVFDGLLMTPDGYWWRLSKEKFGHYELVKIRNTGELVAEHYMGIMGPWNRKKTRAV